MPAQRWLFRYEKGNNNGILEGRKNMISGRIMNKMDAEELREYADALQYYARTQEKIMGAMWQIDVLSKRVAEHKEAKRELEERNTLEAQGLRAFSHQMEAKYDKPIENVSECSDLPFTTDNKEESEATVNDFLRYKACDIYANIYMDGEFVEQTKENKSEKYGNEKPTCYSIGQIEGKPCFQIFIGGKNP